jgi:tRNA uridine 5-carboxymethylaminomethyl modification enzyme
LSVRQDNALRRLAPIAIDLGLFSDEERAIVAHRLAAEDEALRLATSVSIRPEQVNETLVRAGSAPLEHGVKIADVARRQHVSLGDLFAAADVGQALPRDALITAELELKYAGYFEREREQAEKMKRMGQFVLDDSVPYAEFHSLSFESRQKLASIRPATLAQAARIPGVSPTDLQNLVLEIEKRRRRPNHAPV